MSGFKTTNNYAYADINNTINAAAVGLDATDGNKFKIQVVGSGTAIPSGSPIQISIDPAANGNITITPNGAGSAIVSYLANGAVVSNALGALSYAATGAAGQVLTSNGPTVAPSFQPAGGGGGVTSITGTANQITASAPTGAVTLSTPVTFTGPGYVAATTNFLLPATTATTGQLQINSTRFIAQGTGNSIPSSSTYLGAGAGVISSAAGNYNTGVGYIALTNLVNGGVCNTGIGAQAGVGVAGNYTTYVGCSAGYGNGTNANDGNTGIGFNALSTASTNSQFNTAVGSSSMAGTATSGAYNTAIGANSLASITSGSDNWAGGRYTMNANTTGSFNSACGSQALVNLAGAGDHNIAAGYQAGSAYTSTESSNIVIGNAGVIADSHQIRIGTQGSGSAQQNLCNIAGIYGSTVGGTNAAVFIDNAGNLGTVGGSGGGGGTIVTTFSTPGSDTWTKNAGTKYVEVYIFDGGGGGGSGRRGASAAASGGGGGCPGNSIYYQGPGFAFGATATVVVGAGGTGGAAITTDNTDGADGSFGGHSSFGNIDYGDVTSTFGGGGSTTTGNGTGSGTIYVNSVQATSSYTSSSNGQAGAPSNAQDDSLGTSGQTFLAGTGGGGGSGADSGGGPFAGGNGGGLTDISNLIYLVAQAAGGIEGGTIDGADGADGTAAVGFMMAGFGGGGGGGQSAGGAAGNGGKGGFPGGGGGGGGGSINGTDSGAGGDGGDGMVVVIEYLG